MTRIDRIMQMEQVYDRACAALAQGRYDLPEFTILRHYLDSGEWLEDYEADEAMLISPGIKRGVLAQDALYDLITEWETAMQKQKPVIHLFGASGSGTTTLGSALSRRLHFKHMDTDNYFWLPTDPMFTEKRPVQERITLINQDIDEAEHGAVLSGSLVGWGDVLMPRLTLVVRVVTAAAVRIARLRAREYARFGERICEGGDMYAQHQEFLDWAARYDTGDITMRSKARHDAWQKELTCPVVTVNGEEAPEVNVEKILALLENA